MKNRGKAETTIAVLVILQQLHNRDKQPVNVEDLSEQAGFSVSYIEQLFTSLRGRGLVSSMRGPGGGYYPTRDPNEVTLDQVVLAVLEPPGVLDHPVIKYVNSLALGALGKVTLAQAVQDVALTG